MEEKLPDNKPTAADIEELKKTTRISLDQVLNANPLPKKATAAITGEKKSTGLISGILTHTAPIPQTIRLKRPSTSPIVINPSDITSAPTVVKTAHAKVSTTPISEPATVVRKPIPPRPTSETSRIILELDSPAPDIRRKTAPIPSTSPIEPTPAPKTIRLKRPSSVVAIDQTAAAPAADIQTLKKSETAKIELKDAAVQAPITQHKTIKIKRTDRNIISRNAGVQRGEQAAPQAETIIQPSAISETPDEDSSPVFAVLSSAAVICLFLLVYLLAAQSFGPNLSLPVPSGLF